MRRIYSNFGYSIFELLITVVVLATLVGIAVPNLSAFIERRQIQTQISQINDAFTLARSAALSKGQTATICWNTGGAVNNAAAQNTMVITQAGAGGATETLKVVNINNAGYNVSSTALAGDCLAFDPQGRAPSAVSFGVCKIDGNIQNLMTVRITNTGRPSITRADKSDPNPNNFSCTS